MQSYDIVAIGSATRDVCVSTENARVLDMLEFSTGKGLCLPFGSKVPVKKIVFSSGGGGTNAAVTFARQGFSVACIGVLGQDANGLEILDELRREQVDGKYFQLHRGGATAYSVILVGAPVQAGERTILSYKGEGVHWNADAIPWDRISAKWLYINSLGGHVEIIERAAMLARTTGVHLATNPGGKELELGLKRLAPLWEQFDVVGMNQEEAAALTGISYNNPEEIFKTLDKAIGGICIMTRGSRGVMVSDGRNVYSAGIPNRDVVERTGAGDAFHAGFLAEFIRSGSIEKAIQLGTANASSVVMQYGAKQGILRKGDLGAWPLVQVSVKPLQ